MWSVLVLAAVNAVLSIAPHFLTARDHRGGSPRYGVVIFVESIRWLGVRWGMRTATAGLRAAGFKGELLYWRWHLTWRACLVIPALADRRLLERESRRLADYIADLRREFPDRPVYLMGYSCGGYVAVRALELLGGTEKVDAAAVLAGAVSPLRDLRPACRSLTGPLVISSSPADWFIVGLGTLLFGTADRVFVPSMGMIGPWGGARRCEKIVSIRWGPRMLGYLHLGGHFSAASSGFIRRIIVPALGITADDSRGDSASRPSGQ